MPSFSLLLIEDNQIDQMAFRAMIQEQHLDYEYVIAGSIAEARTYLKDHQFDIIVVDHILGDGTAFDILADHHDMPVIFVTGSGNEQLAVQAMKSGAYDYLTKDSSQRYLALLPIVVHNAVNHTRAEREAREMLRERIRRETLEEFIHDASHDLRTPLTTLGTSIYLLNRYAAHLVKLVGASSPNLAAIQSHAATMEQHCNRIEGYKNHLEQIILDMIEMVRVDHLIDMEMEIFDINRLVNQIVQSHQDHALLKSQVLLFEPSSGALPVRGNPYELATAFRNLVRNALHFTPANGTINVVTKKVAHEIVVSITDSGIGISPEHLNRIFDRFYRVDRARNMSHSGSGLGLSIAKQIVELHHGRIEVESILEQGSTFRVIVPGKIA